MGVDIREVIIPKHRQDASFRENLLTSSTMVHRIITAISNIKICMNRY